MIGVLIAPLLALAAALPVQQDDPPLAGGLANEDTRVVRAEISIRLVPVVVP